MRDGLGAYLMSLIFMFRIHTSPPWSWMAMRPVLDLAKSFSLMNLLPATILSHSSFYKVVETASFPFKWNSNRPFSNLIEPVFHSPAGLESPGAQATRS
jgi:hypothetical protein